MVCTLVVYVVQPELDYWWWVERAPVYTSIPACMTVSHMERVKEAPCSLSPQVCLLYLDELSTHASSPELARTKTDRCVDV